MGSPFLDDLLSDLDRIATGPASVHRVAKAPARTTIATSEAVFSMDAAVLSTDIRSFSGMVNAFGRQAMVAVIRSFFSGMIRIVAENHGQIADFNGDGMIAVFDGDDRVDRAIRAAGQAGWFVEEVLRRRLHDIFVGSQLVPDAERIAMFDAGFAVDEGVVFACSVGHSGGDDPVWIGACVNRSAKLCKLARHPTSIMVTRDAFDRMTFTAGDPFHSQWLVAGEAVKVGGVQGEVLMTEQMIAIE